MTSSNLGFLYWRPLRWAALFLVSFGPLTASADVLYTILWRGTKYTSSNGTIARQSFSEKLYVNQVARDYGLPATDLVLVYRPEKRDISMVRRSTGAFVASIIQMEYAYTDVSTADGASSVRQTFLFDEYHTSSIGTAVGSERIQRNGTGAIIGFSFAGRFNYAYPEDGAIFTGNFSTGARITDRTGS